MGELQPHLFVLVGREVHDEQPAGWCQGAGRLGDRGGGVVEEVQNVMQHRNVDRTGLDVEVVDVSVTYGAVGEVVESASGDVQHVGAQIDPDAEVDAIGQEFEHPTGAGANVEEGAHPVVADLGNEGRLNRLVTDVQGSNGVPVGGDALEVGGRSLVAVGTNRGQSFEVTAHGSRRLLAIDHQAEHGVEQLTTDPITCRPVEHAGALRLSVEQTRIGEHLEVTTDSGLALGKHPAQLPNGQLALGQDVERPESGWFSDRP